MDYRTFLPHPLLRPYIVNYWSLSSDIAGLAPEESCIVPDGNTSLMFIDEILYRRRPQQAQASRHLRQCLLIGQKSQPVFYSFPPGQTIETFGVRFRPLGLDRFIKVPMHQLSDLTVEAERLFGPAINSLYQRLLEQKDLSSVRFFLDKFFLGRLERPTEKYGLAQQLVGQILRQKGQVKIADLTSRSAVSARQADRLFRHFLGLSPKHFARIIRFNHCIYEYNRKSFDKLTDLAYANGYFDQMHFIKEVKSFTLKTPGHFFNVPSRMGDALQQVLTERFETNRQNSRTV